MSKPVKEQRVRTYNGVRSPQGKTQVYVSGRPIARRLDLEQHLPDGLDWGANVKGTKRLALAILVDYFSSLDDGELGFWDADRQGFIENSALAEYEKFSVEVLEPIQTDQWVMFDLEIARWLDDKKRYEPLCVSDVGPIEEPP